MITNTNANNSNNNSNNSNNNPKTLIIKEILGSELLTRASARSLVALIDQQCTLDFSEVTFMSRTFADEVCCMLVQNPNVKVTNMCPLVGTLFDIVKEGRLKPRQRTASDSKVLTFDDIESLSAFLSSLR